MMSVEDSSKVVGRGNRETLRDPDLNVECFKRPSGILRLIQFVLTILLLDLTKPPMLLFVGHMSLLIKTIWILVYLFNVQEKRTINCSWLILEIITTVAIVLLTLVSGLVVTITSATRNSHYLDGGICCLTLGIIGLVETFILAMRWREGKLNQQITSVTSPRV